MRELALLLYCLATAAEVRLYVHNCEDSLDIGPCNVDCGQGERNITKTEVVLIEEGSECKEVNSTRAEVCLADQQCPGERHQQQLPTDPIFL